MKNLFALLAALLLVSFYANAQDNDDVCTATTTSTFCIHVEEAIGVEADQDMICIEEGICPSCSVPLDEDDCMEFEVTGGEACHANVLFNGSAPSNNVGYFAYDNSTNTENQNVYILGYWQYSDMGEGSTWNSIPTSVTSWDFNNDDDADDDENTIGFRLCGTIYATCDAVEGNYNIPIICTANYTCGTN